MARIQPVLTEAENALVDQMASLTRTKRSEVIKNALTVYDRFLRQAVTGARVVARKPTGEEVVLETAEPKDRNLFGSLDLLERDRDGRLVGVDFKTSARKYACNVRRGARPALPARSERWG